MPEENADQLEQNRFNITPESLGLLDKTRLVFRDLQKDNPYLSGIGFFGSRTKGTETSESDLDIIIFFNTNKLNPDENPTEKLVKIKEHISGVLGIPLGSHVGWEKNISLEKTDIDIYRYLRFAQTLTTLPREKAIEVVENNFEAQNLFSRFFLAIGEELYKNRAYILDQFEGVSKNDFEFGLLMDALASFEADNRIDDSSKREYTRLPKTINDARNYFLTDINLHEISI